MSQVQETHRKLHEAQSFFQQLLKLERFTQSNIIEKPEEFHSNLSAFLSAARSVSFVMRKEQSRANESWFPDWHKALSTEEKQLLKFFNHQRVGEVHKLGADVIEEKEGIPVNKLIPDDRLHPAYQYGVTESAPVGTPPSLVYRRVYYFKIDETRKQVTDWCREYLTLLKQMVKEFEQHLAATGTSPD